MTVGEKIRKLRTDKSMTQRELAGDRITRNMLSLIEKGRALPSVETLKYIAERLKVSSGYLLADEKEDAGFELRGKIEDIRVAYSNREFEICADLCREYGTDDDEINLLLANCCFELGKEFFYNDSLRMAASKLDLVFEYAEKTIHYTKNIEAAAWAYFKYFELISPSLMSDNMDYEAYNRDAVKFLTLDDDFCKYVLALQTGESRNLFGESEGETAYVKLVSAMRDIDNERYEKAAITLDEVLNLDYMLPGAVLYRIFCDLEFCCEKLGDSEAAKTYSEAKISQFERIMS